MSELPQLKKELEWLSEVDSTSLQATIQYLDDGLKRFFEKQKEHKKNKTSGYSKKTLEKAARTGRVLTSYDLEGHPKFKSKKNPVQSYSSKCVKSNIQPNRRKPNQTSETGLGSF
jgi:putative transposase